VDFGLILPAMGDDSSREGLEAACEAAERHGLRDVWGTDHLVVGDAARDDYGRIFEIVTLLAWVAGRYRTIRVGASVVVVPMRNAVVLAKELATIDALSEGRLIAGFGSGWIEDEFDNVGVADRFHVRGAYLEETINLCRHLWSGSTEPFRGRFHQLDDFTFGPLPRQGAALPIWLGGRNERAVQRAGRLADGYHATSSAPASIAGRVPAIRAAADAAGRPMPVLSNRVRVELEGPARESFTLHGTPEAVAAGIREYAEAGVTHLALSFPSSDPEGIAREIDRFASEVLPLV
jgi:probable F420-dependent oxidoreductase